jgi:hypothetical protein
MKRTILSGIAATLLLAFTAVRANAEPKKLTSTITWELADSTLYITGEGKMPSYQTNSNWPWKDAEVAEKIAHIVISEGITEIGAYDFYSPIDVRPPKLRETVADGDTKDFAETINFKNLRSVSLPSTLKKIGHHAFQRLPITNIDIPESVTCIDNSAFTNSALQYVRLPEGLTRLGHSVFEGCHNLRIVDFHNAKVKLGTGALFDCESLRVLLRTKNIGDVYENSFGCTAFSQFNATELLMMLREDGIEHYLETHMPDRQFFDGSDEDYDARRVAELNKYYARAASQETSAFEYDQFAPGNYDASLGGIVITSVNHGKLFIPCDEATAAQFREQWNTVRSTARPTFTPTTDYVELQSVKYTLDGQILVAAVMH